MKLRLGKKAMEIPIHYVIMLAILLVICMLIITGVYLKSTGEGGLISRMFSSFGR